MQAQTKVRRNIEMEFILLALTLSCGGGKSDSKRDALDLPQGSPPATSEIKSSEIPTAADPVAENSGDASSVSPEAVVSEVLSGPTVSQSEGSGLQNWVPFKVVVPAHACFATSAQTIDIQGTCESGEKISLDGDVLAQDVVWPLSQNASICQNNEFHFILSLDDGTHYIEVLSDQLGRRTPTLTIIVDRTRPAPVQVIQPLLNPVASGDASLRIEGYCEIGATVTIQGDFSSQTNCSNNGLFALTAQAPSPGVYQMALIQTDSVGLSSESVQLLWTFDNSIPPSPNLIAPSDLSPVSRSSSLEVHGTCLDGYRIRLDGSVPGGSIDQLCSAGFFSFLVEQTQDGVYSIHIFQSNPNNLYDSNPIPILWTIDNTVPSAPALSNHDLTFETPGPTTLLGNCEALARVTVAGVQTFSVDCNTQGHFALNLDESLDGEYRYELFQVDRAGNESPRSSLIWKRNNTLLATPVLLTPLTSEVITNSNKLILSGTCLKTASIGLMSNGSLELVNPSTGFEQDCIDGTFSFTLMQPLSVSQSFTTVSIWQEMGAVSSDMISLTWTYDRVAPQAFFSQVPQSQNIQVDAVFAFHADDTSAQFECRLDANAWFSCSSAFRLDKLTSGQHTFDVRARDAADNISDVISHSWLQIAHQTVALLHFNANADLFDSSLFSETFELAIQSEGTQLNPQGRFAEGRLFNRTREDRLLADLTLAFQTLTRTATFEAWINFDSFSTAAEQSIISLGTAEQPCVKFSVIKVGGRQSSHRKMVLTVTLDNGTTTRINSGNITLTEGSGHFHHLAVTFNMGEVRFSLDGIQKGRAVAGVLGVSSMKTCQGALLVGEDVSGLKHFGGTIDELRLSNIVRYPGAFVPSTQPFTPD